MTSSGNDPLPTSIAAEGTPHTYFEAVVVGASAGGISALGTLLSALPVSFPVPTLIVQHCSPNHPSYLAEILSKQTELAVQQAKDHSPIYPANVYIAPPNYHLLVGSPQELRLSQTEPIHYVRPAVDNLFISAAQVFKDRVIGVILTGTGKDGMNGACAIYKAGGVMIVQNRTTSKFFGMPGEVISTGCANQILPLQEIAESLCTLVLKEDND